MLTVRGLRKRFTTDSGHVVAVEGISFSVERGEFYTLLGPSGCGKTTTLQCIAGIETPDEGEIEMHGQCVYSSARKVLVPGHRRDLGMVFQSYAVWPHMTVFENVAFPLVHGRLKVPNSEVAERVRRALSLVQLDGLEQRPAPFLSGGQQQRVALARAIVHEPALLLLDEPLSNLDAKLRDEMRTEVRELVKRLGITTIYVTHDQVEALSMSDRIALMRAGTIVQEGSPRNIYLSPETRYIAAFVGKMNFLTGTVVSNGESGTVDSPLGRLGCDLPRAFLPGQQVVLGVRPEGILVSSEQPSEMTNVTQGVVEHTSFIGNMVECQVLAASERLLVNVEPFAAIEAGQRVYLRIPPGRCIVMPATRLSESEPGVGLEPVKTGPQSVAV